MPDFVTLTCPTCGGKLEITNDIERFACGYCGHEHIVKRGGGIISISPIADDVKGIKSGVDKVAAELALVRLTNELEMLTNIQQDSFSKEKYLKEFYIQYYDNEKSNNAFLKFELYRFIYCLMENIDNIEIPVEMSDPQYKEFFKQRIYALTIDDLDYLIDKALFDAVNPSKQHDVKYLRLIKKLRALKEHLKPTAKPNLDKSNLEIQINNLRSEIDKLKSVLAN